MYYLVKIKMGVLSVKRWLSLTFVFLMVFSLAACGGSKTEPGKVVVSGKEFTEQIILTHILAEYLKANTDLDVEVKGSLGGVFVLQEALKKGDIDMYVEYTGTGYMNVLKEEYEPGMSPDEIYQATKKGMKRSIILLG